MAPKAEAKHVYVSNGICDWALGDLEEETSRQIRTACSEDVVSFERLPAPLSGDWLDDHEEKGQTFNGFRRRLSSDCVPPSYQMHTILIVPMGASFRSVVGAEWLEHILSYCRTFFTGCDVEALADSIPLDGVGHRQNEFQHRQYRISDLFEILEVHDAVRRHPGLQAVYCRLGVTLEDIYPNEDYNYSFGQASIDKRVGMFSFARQSPFFYESMHAVEAAPRLKEHEKMVWLRSVLHTMVHEIGHILGMRHCVYYRCLMNGNNGADDSAGRSSFLCPICLRKLFTALAGISQAIHPLARYAEIRESLLAMQQAICPAIDLVEDVLKDKDVAWLGRRIKVLEIKEAAIEQREQRARVSREKVEAKTKAKAKGEAKTTPQDEQAAAGVTLQESSSERPMLEVPEPQNAKSVFMKLQSCTNDEFQIKHGIKGHISKKQLAKKRGELQKIFADFLESASLEALHQYRVLSAIAPK